MRILLLVGLVWVGASLAFALYMAITWGVRASKEKQRFREFLKGGGGSIPEKAAVCYDDETFIGGTIFFSNGQSFSFSQESAFRWGLEQSGLGSECVRC